MGCLINPIGFRIGSTRDWEDVWFAYHSNYSEFLHFVLKLRFFLTNVFNSFPTDLESYSKNVEPFPWFKNQRNELLTFFSKGVLYSHFRMVFNHTTMVVFIFLYPGQYWDFFHKNKVYKRWSVKKTFSRFRFSRIKFLHSRIRKVRISLGKRLLIGWKGQSVSYKKFSKFFIKDFGNSHKKFWKKKKNLVILVFFFYHREEKLGLEKVEDLNINL